MNKKGKEVLMLLIGLAFLLGGFLCLQMVENPQGMMEALPFVCIGCGCGLFGGGFGSLTGKIILDKNPEAKKIKEIEEKDERNQEIGRRAKAKAYDMMISVFGVLVLVFAMIGMEAAPILMLVCAYLFVVGYGIYYRLKYEKEM